MNRQEMLLSWLASELIETAQAVHKILHFGIDDLYPERKMTNREALELEFNHVFGVLALLKKEGIELKIKPELIEAKQVKMSHWMAYAKGKGTLREVNENGAIPGGIPNKTE